MKRLLVGVVLGALVVLGLPALADHIQEPTTPIEEIQLFVGHYSTGTSVGCQDGEIGTWPMEFTKLRANLYVLREKGTTSEPSEHFDITVTVMDGNRIHMRETWRHQNIGAHKANRWQIDALDIGGMPDRPGTWDVHFKVEGNESRNVLEAECIFVVPEE